LTLDPARKKPQNGSEKTSENYHLNAESYMLTGDALG